MSDAHVYAVAAKVRGGLHVKIGQSKRPEQRVAGIASMSPVPLEHIFTAAGLHVPSEPALHGLFGDRRLHGEWFRFSRSEADAIFSESGISRISRLLALRRAEFTAVLAITHRDTVSDAIIRLLHLPDWAFDLILSRPKYAGAKRRGRPATGVAPQRNIRVSDGDWQLIARAAEAAGVSRSEFIREAALAKARRLLRPPSPPQP